jgi:hypothetical protein
VIRWLSPVLTVVFALLCLACMSLWLRSYWAQDVVIRVHYLFPPGKASLDEIRIISSEGGIYFNRIFVRTDYDPSMDDRNFHLRNNGWSYSPRYYFDISARELFVREGGRAFFGFGYKSTRRIESLSSRVVDNMETIRHQLLIPWAFLVVVFCIMEALLVRALWRSCRRRLRLAHKQCPECGYDMRATPEKCSECGATAKP